jgi:hypothetical protein
MKTNTTLKKNLYGILLSLLTPMAAQADAVLYQQDFSSYSGSITTPGSVGWQYPWNDGFEITDQGTGTGMSLWHIGGFSSPMSPVSSNATQIVVKSLLWPQWGFATAGLTSTGFNDYNNVNYAEYNTDQWSGYGPRLQFSDAGNLSILRGGNEGAAASAAVAVSGVTAGNANFSLVIDVTTGLADAYFGSPETGTLVINDFDLKGTSDFATWQANIRSMDNFVIRGNQAIVDNISVEEIVATPPAVQPGITVYQQDFGSYTSPTSAEAGGWSGSYATIGGSPGWGSIENMGTTTGNLLWVISGWTHGLTSPLNPYATKIVVKSLIWPQVNFASVGLFSGDFNTSPTWNGAGWSGTGPTMTFSGGNFSLTRSVNAGQGSSNSRAILGVTPGNANFSMVIDVETGLADGYYGSTLLINDFDLKGTQTLSQFRADLLANTKIGVLSNQGLFDNIEVSMVVPPPTYASWAAVNAGGQTADLDWDNDGVTNGVEFFMNAPAGFTANPSLVGNTVTWPNGGNITSSEYGSKFVAQTSTDLANWSDLANNDITLSNTAGALTWKVASIANGDMDSFPTDLPGSWVVSGGDLTSGPSLDNSPFTNKFADNGSSWLIDDSADTSGSAGFLQVFSNKTNYPSVSVNFDFKVPTLTPGQANGTWGIQFDGAGADLVTGSSSVHYRIDASGQFAINAGPAGGVITNILALEADKWYNVRATFTTTAVNTGSNNGAGVQSGTITPAGGSPVSWSNVPLLYTSLGFSRLLVRDRSTSSTGELLLDNVSVAPQGKEFVRLKVTP